MDLAKLPLRPRLERDGQPYIDKPRYIQPKPGCGLADEDHALKGAVLEVLSAALAGDAIRRGAVPMVYARPGDEARRQAKHLLEAGPHGGTSRRPILVGYTTVRLRWMKPDGKGGLVPR